MAGYTKSSTKAVHRTKLANQIKKGKARATTRTLKSTAKKAAKGSRKSK